MYYLKYRPRTIGEIDNAERRDTLAKVLGNPDSLPHAFVFIGPKGTGKTSTARIIAKAVNCEHNLYGRKGQSVEPCNDCASCVAIAKNRFLDVYELDAASNRGIDDVRALRDQVGFAPSVGRYKVYIIDEVHMLTKEAFNALLKTLEEPPPKVIFILATTEGHKLPATVLSRCINIQFHKGNHEEIVNSLKRIVKGEKLKASEEVLALLSKKSGGSFRDAAKLLEMAAASTDLSVEQVTRQFKGDLYNEPVELLGLMVGRETRKALEWLDRYDQAGGNFGSLVEELLEIIHQQLLAKRDLVKGDTLEGVTLGHLNRLLKVLLEAYQLGKFSPIESLPLMIAVIDYTGAA